MKKAMKAGSMPDMGSDVKLVLDGKLSGDEMDMKLSSDGKRVVEWRVGFKSMPAAKMLVGLLKAVGM